MGFRLSKIYTRTGDAGETGLADGRRVAKDHPRIEAMGEIDTLNSHIGLLLATLQPLSKQHPGLSDVIAVLEPCQHRLFDLGGELAMPDYQALQPAEVERLELAIDRWNEVVGPLKNFILPGGSQVVAQAHICRSLARSAERRCQQLNAQEPIRKEGLAYINRMSDLLFVAARIIAHHQQVSEVLWQAAPKRAD
ncbi:cob(I)yrinic acid a,c-diamide adenosyltransferase [Pseudomonas sp. EL_65y_Pfl2_R95]|uniref:cob(I)yrinic acid a,c-diamide adenosyltransferase n=1 Tax=Pseudomonas sp. EL_65y_Pfl2_R95 TaxID=3088698 RepID=UPI0030DDB6EA